MMASSKLIKEKPKRRWLVPKIVAASATALVLYVLSIGPFAFMAVIAGYDSKTEKACMIIYRPILARIGEDSWMAQYLMWWTKRAEPLRTGRKHY